MSVPPDEALGAAARLSLSAPSVLGTRAWRWVLRRDCLELYADRTPQVAAVDLDGRLLMLGCGAALHHVRVALGASGNRIATLRLPDPDIPDLVARVWPMGRRHPTPDELELRAAIDHRGTDRPVFSDARVPPDALERLRTAVEREGAYLEVVPPHRVPAPAGRGGTAYTVLFGPIDAPEAWLCAGEALSALLLTAETLGLAAALDEPVGAAWPRRLMRDLLDGLGEPYAMVRVGHPVRPTPPAVPRRGAGGVVNAGGAR